MQKLISDSRQVNLVVAEIWRPSMFGVAELALKTVFEGLDGPRLSVLVVPTFRPCRRFELTHE